MLTAAGKQIGNAVPVEMGKHLIQHIKSKVFNHPAFKDEETMVQRGIEHESLEV